MYYYFSVADPLFVSDSLPQSDEVAAAVGATVADHRHPSRFPPSITVRAGCYNYRTLPLLSERTPPRPRPFNTINFQQPRNRRRLHFDDFFFGPAKIFDNKANNVSKWIGKFEHRFCKREWNCLTYLNSKYDKIETQRMKLLRDFFEQIH